MHTTNMESRPPVLHQVKCHRDHFEDVLARRKRAELRDDDRNYQAADYMLLTEVEDTAAGLRATNRSLLLLITHKLAPGQYGLDARTCMLSIEVLATYKPA